MSKQPGRWRPDGRVALLLCDAKMFAAASVFGVAAAWYMLINPDVLRLFPGILWGIGMALGLLGTPFFPQSTPWVAWISLLVIVGKYTLPWPRVRHWLCPATAMLVLTGAYTLIFIVIAS